MQNDRTRTRRAARILVADDDHLVLEMVTDLLTVHGFTVLTAADGEEALAVIKREHPDLILLDVMMPKLCGYEVAR
ncbi:MAG: response regulator, partial [Candidatus Methylomirabilales bacterium]